VSFRLRQHLCLYLQGIKMHRENLSVVITVEPKHGKTIPPLEAQDITVQQGHDKRPVTGLSQHNARA
jgi:hypothetical protein